jgi:hypothetical protein
LLHPTVNTWNCPGSAPQSPCADSLLFSRLSTSSQIFPRTNKYLYYHNSHLFHINMASELDPVDEALNNDEKVVEVLPPSSKKAEKKAVTGETSMAPPLRERHGPRQDACAFIHPGSHQQEKAPGPNATCSATSPRAAEKRRPPIPDIWDGPSARREGFTYKELPQAHFVFDPRRGFESYYGDQRYENASAPYGNHSSGPFMFDLSINLASTRHQLVSLQDVVRQVSFRFWHF